MGYSQAQKAESRQRVLDTAARQIREHGLEAFLKTESENARKPLPKIH